MSTYVRRWSVSHASWEWVRITSHDLVVADASPRTMTPKWKRIGYWYGHSPLSAPCMAAVAYTVGWMAVRCLPRWLVLLRCRLPVPQRPVGVGVVDGPGEPDGATPLLEQRHLELVLDLATRGHGTRMSLAHAWAQRLAWAASWVGNVHFVQYTVSLSHRLQRFGVGVLADHVGGDLLVEHGGDGGVSGGADQRGVGRGAVELGLHEGESAPFVAAHRCLQP